MAHNVNGSRVCVVASCGWKLMISMVTKIQNKYDPCDGTTTHGSEPLPLASEIATGVRLPCVALILVMMYGVIPCSARVQ